MPSDNNNNKKGECRWVHPDVVQSRRKRTDHQITSRKLLGMLFRMPAGKKCSGLSKRYNYVLPCFVKSSDSAIKPRLQELSFWSISRISIHCSHLIWKKWWQHLSGVLPHWLVNKPSSRAVWASVCVCVLGGVYVCACAHLFLYHIAHFCLLITWDTLTVHVLRHFLT